MSSRDCTDTCEQYEKALGRIREDIVDSMEAWIAKITDSSHAKHHGVLSTPAIIFYRKQNPILYDGALNEDEMLEFFITNRESDTKVLTDENFEHLTQASSGATTGDWLLFFHHDGCSACEEVTPTLEAAASRSRHHQNVAKINMKKGGVKTARRFGIYEAPSFLLLHLGRVYRYPFQETSVETLIKFMQKGFDLTQGNPVPLPKSYPEEVWDSVIAYATENWLYLVLVCSGILLMVCIVSYNAIALAKEKAELQQKRKKHKRLCDSWRAYIGDATRFRNALHLHDDCDTTDVKTADRGQREARWKEKPLHGQHPKIMDEPSIDSDVSYNWLKTGLLNAETESNILTIQDQCIVPIIIGTTGVVLKDLKGHVRKLECEISLDIHQRTAILGTASVLRREFVRIRRVWDVVHPPSYLRCRQVPWSRQTGLS
ncbi:unnamed protein product, partial [Darwinula stevensoni]